MNRIDGAAATRPLRSLLYAAAVLFAAAIGPAHGQDAERGAYIAKAAGCVSCHTHYKADGAAYAGGRPLATPFGTFYSPNITPDLETGIGGWSDADFVRALRDGVGPKGQHYFPVFPYTSYTRLTDSDMLDLKAYLFSLEPVRAVAPAHDVPFPFNVRIGQFFWKQLFLDRGPEEPDPAQSAAWNRGRYLVRAAAHCGECHTPRNVLGGLRDSMDMAGTLDGPEGARAPNITPDHATGIGTWSTGDIVNLLKTTFKPDFDNVQGTMEEAIEHGLKDLSDDDLNAIAIYLRSVPAVVNDVPRR
ncbi:MAG: cytochrome c [Alphaproteobacteria bacterium]